MRPQVIALAQFGVGYDVGGRENNDDRYTAFSVVLPDGRRFTIAGVRRRAGGRAGREGTQHCCFALQSHNTDSGGQEGHRASDEAGGVRAPAGRRGQCVAGSRAPRRAGAAQVFDGHHRHHVAQLVADALPAIFTRTLEEHQDVIEALVGGWWRLGGWVRGPERSWHGAGGGGWRGQERGGT